MERPIGRHPTPGTFTRRRVPRTGAIAARNSIRALAPLMQYLARSEAILIVRHLERFCDGSSVLTQTVI